MKITYQEFLAYKEEFSKLEEEYKNAWKESPLNKRKLSRLANELVRINEILETKKNNNV